MPLTMKGIMIRKTVMPYWNSALLCSVFFFWYCISSVFGQQDVLDLEIEVTVSSAHGFTRQGSLRVLQSGEYWSIKWDQEKSTTQHWGYQGIDIIGLETLPLEEDGEKVGEHHRAFILPAPIIFEADELIQCAWLAYCSKAYFKSLEQYPHPLDVPWRGPNLIVGTSYDSSDMDFNHDHFLPERINWKWDSNRRAELKQLLPFFTKIRISPREERWNGAIVGKYEALEWKKIDETTFLPLEFHISRKYTPNSANKPGRSLSEITGTLRNARWRRLNASESFIPAYPSNARLRINDYRFSDNTYFKLNNFYYVENLSAWPDRQHPVVMQALVRTKQFYDQQYRQPPKVHIPFFGRVEINNFLLFAVFVAIMGFLMLYWKAWEKSRNT